MNTYQTLASEAQATLKKIDDELDNIKCKVAKAKRHLSQWLLLPALAVPFGIGYTLFKKSSKQNNKVQPSNKLPQLAKSISLPKQLMSVLPSWLPSIAGEAVMLFLGKWVGGLLNKPKNTSEN
jgi:hypothetical protein